MFKIEYTDHITNKEITTRAMTEPFLLKMSVFRPRSKSSKITKTVTGRKRGRNEKDWNLPIEAYIIHKYLNT